ncbi:DUF1254 domain-containing protein [Mesorhizobium delmotii]|uniref:DUF1254 domain-containing protein n=1 Tax=Mesorhizobium delmotii TaxID=1631247 RepID=A0A2P9AVM5_9HYPH|nr:DUF1254 domain-containing protein [Mesorhizobium delmotii]SJM35257.1 conserved hypothetical protein [Mesorhizobium delmotii]
MKVSRRVVAFGGLGLLTEAVLGTITRVDAASQDPLLSAAVDAYIYGYPLAIIDMTRRQLTNVATVGPTRAPRGQLRRLRSYPAVDDRSVPAPNADTLYTDAWLDVWKEPMVLTMPDMGDRYFQMPMLSGWSDVFQSPGTRTTGQKAQTYAITGPGWSGELPAGVTELKSPTGIIWILGRIYCTGTPEDYAKVHALQDQISLVSLSQYGKAYTPAPASVDPGIDTETPPREQVNAMSVNDYFRYLAELMKTNPPLPQDAPILARVASIGLTPGQDFDPSKLSALDQAAVDAVPKLALQKMLERFANLPTLNGWIDFGPSVASWGTDYVLRALCNMLGPGWNLPADAVYPTSEKGTDGKDFDGNHKYVIHFEKGQMPPVEADGFWSLTMYDGDKFFVPNALNRYTISQRDNLVANADGSVDIYLQADSPGKDKEANWLPAPKAKFSVMLRMYIPKEGPVSILDGSWKPPAIQVAQ